MLAREPTGLQAERRRKAKSPPMVRRVSRFDGHKGPTKCRASLAACLENTLHRGAIVRGVGDSGAEQDRGAARRRPMQANLVLCRHGRRRVVQSLAPNHMPDRRPIGVAIHQRADHSAVQRARESLVMRLRRPLGNDLIPVGEGSYSKPALIRRSATVARAVGGVRLLETLARLVRRTGGMRRGGNHEPDYAMAGRR
jgi:hypothetical protein